MGFPDLGLHPPPVHQLVVPPGLSAAGHRSHAYLFQHLVDLVTLLLVDELLDLVEVGDRHADRSEEVLRGRAADATIARDVQVDPALALAADVGGTGCRGRRRRPRLP